MSTLPRHEIPEAETRVLRRQERRILDEATAAIRRSHLRHYEAWAGELLRQRLEELFDLIVDCVRRRRTAPVVAFARDLGRERYRAGFDLEEVQIVFSALGEATWKAIRSEVDPRGLADALARVSTVLGAGKDAVAQTYVALAAGHEPPPVDPASLFRGTDGV